MVSVRARLRGCGSLKCSVTTRRVLAWDAPGYGASTPVDAASPVASGLRGGIEATGSTHSASNAACWSGHSLGAIIAGAFAAANPPRVAGLLLLSPAGGYGAASAEVRETKRDRVLRCSKELGPQGLAEKRSTNMLSAHASDEARDMGALEHVAHRSRKAMRRRRICSPTPISPATSTRYKGRISGRGRRRRHHHDAPKPASDSRKPPARSLQVVPRARARRLYRSTRRVHRDHRHVLPRKRRTTEPMNDVRHA